MRILGAFILTLGLSVAASAQEMSAQQREFAALFRQCAEQIRERDTEPARQSVRDACRGQMQELIGSKLDNWAGRITSVGIQTDAVELEVAPFDREKVAVLTRILPIRVYTSDGGEMNSEPYYKELVAQLKRLGVRRGDPVRITGTMLTGELGPGMLPHLVRYAGDRLEISLNTMTVSRP